MLDSLLNRLLNGYSLSLLAVAVLSFVAVVRLMRQALSGSEQENLSVLELSMETLSRSIMEKRWDVIVLMSSSGWLYDKLVGRSRHDISWMSWALTFGGSIVVVLVLVGAAVFAKLLSPRQVG
jgi:hypothetical protein